MHRSKLVAALVDVPDESFAATTSFWSRALGRAAVPGVTNPEYAELGEALPGLHVMVQRVGTDGPRVHLDIETDDVEAEVRRLEALGATRVEQNHRLWVLRDPTGLLFCVVPIQIPERFDDLAQTWE